MKQERGVSEVLGYVLVISIVTVTIAVVMTMGIGGLQASQQSEQINNMERGFDVLAHNIEEMVDGEAPSRATELRLADGSLTYDESVTINVTHEEELVGNLSIFSRPLTYDSGSGTTISYEAGAVIRTDGENSRMLADPRFLITDDAVVISGVRTRPKGGTDTQVHESGTVLIRGEYLGNEIESTVFTGDETVNVTVETERADAWESYFEQQDIGEVSTDDSGVTFTMNATEFDADDPTVYVLRTRTRFTFAD